MNSTAKASASEGRPNTCAASTHASSRSGTCASATVSAWIVDCLGKAFADDAAAGPEQEAYQHEQRVVTRRDPEIEPTHSEKKRKPRARDDVCAHAGAEQRQG